ncbi:MAG: EamA family transporter [Ruminococcus sp.]|nr:EamA family transporter [Ruminococcus sp.]
MSRLAAYSLLIVLSTFISSLSQILLKKAAQKTYPSKLREYLDPMVILAYGIFFLCTLISMYGLKVVPLSSAPILESTGYIFISVLSYLFFRERLDRRQLLGMALVLIGIAVFSAGQGAFSG